MVICRCEPGPLGLTLSGATAQGSGTLFLAFRGEAPAGLPAQLQSPQVHEIEPGTYRIASARGQWTFDARAHFLHRDASAVFYAAIPPRPVPWHKRLFWRLILALAGSPAGRLLARRGQGLPPA